ncbi:hypothetical protein FOMA001_g19461 [Fusarium oxysporum f. sp. matthiolae]|nr:hypothetical protein FOMA001_g19461 [Fusarium oxysporum f. sp. matthiolae]
MSDLNFEVQVGGIVIATVAVGIAAGEFFLRLFQYIQNRGEARRFEDALRVFCENKSGGFGMLDKECLMQEIKDLAKANGVQAIQN